MTKLRKMVPGINIHPILFIFAVTAFLTGTIVEFILIFTIVIIHELGHLSMAVYYKWRIRRINLWVFGGVMETEEHSCKPVKEEAYILLAGPLQHLWIYILLYALSYMDILPQAIVDLGYLYNTTILAFNLLPVWPLDGGKLLFLLLGQFLSFRKAHSAAVFISLIFSSVAILLSLILFPFTLSSVLLAGFILWENRLEWKRRYYVFMRFLYKRYSTNPVLGRVRPVVACSDEQLIDVFSHFKRSSRHHIYVKNDSRSLSCCWIDERDCLHAYFGVKQYKITAGEISGQNH
ncbi:site-2 protease family protein [Sediminibacillus massiliensis]|uniref:site-2 protease family protein n=1 Tax=Sediminibacillus massiliensis TaxID=1926277 RepID=UPI00098894F5|nr:site-2 protease family protein [Sediminibacillus massiliensis]